jgi:NAD(P) transhydrogenase subunit alpha
MTTCTIDPTNLDMINTAAGSGNDFWWLITILILACFTGYYVVLKVTPALHSPLMSVANAISGIVIVGAIITTGLHVKHPETNWLGFFAVILTMVNVAGGFAITQRMLSMFKKKKNKNKNKEKE